MDLPIATKRLQLEPIGPAHADVLFEALQDERIYAFISSSPPNDIAALRARWAMVNCGCDARGYQSLGWAIRRISDGVYVGKCDAQVTANSVATNVGYLLFPAFWRQGYATEAVRAIVAELVRRGTADMHACVTKGNDASERVLSKVGFTRARVLPNNDTIRGVLCDEIEYVRRAVPR